MKRCISLTLLAGLVSLAGAASSPDAITIKLKEAGKGDVVQVDKTETTAVKTKVADGQGKALLNKSDESMETMSFKETVLEKEGKKPTKLEREYTKAEVKSGGKAKDLPFSGKTVVIEKKGAKYTFAIKGGEELKGPDAAALEKEFNGKNGEKGDFEKLLLPKGAVKENEEWKLDMENIIKEMTKDGEIDVDAAKSTGTGKLLKAYKKDGKQYGVIEIKFVLPLKALGKEAQKLKVADGAKGVFEAKMDVCIDGTEETGKMNGKMVLNATAALPMPEGATLTLDITSDTNETRKDLSKK